MKLKTRWLLLLVALMAGSITRLNAQKLETGTWTGTLTDPGGDVIDVTYAVALSGDTLQITMSAAEGLSAAFSNIRFEEGKMVFSWEANTKIDCTLSPAEGGGYAGACTDSNGGRGQMTMVPPKKDG
ncbi:MAG: hypothetical protein ABI679_05850 [Gemmatimonadota bacterium]